MFLIKHAEWTKAMTGKCRNMEQKTATPIAMKQGTENNCTNRNEAKNRKQSPKDQINREFTRLFP
jgi:hypothetical protein